jgi:hypothetical protein
MSLNTMMTLNKMEQQKTPQLHRNGNWATRNLELLIEEFQSIFSF